MDHDSFPVNGQRRRADKLYPGDHLCAFYESFAEQMAVVSPFIKFGLDAGQRCLYLADDRGTDEILGALRREGPNLEQAMERGALLVLTKDELGLATCPEPEELISLCLQAEETAISDGFSGLRAAVEMTWILDSDDPKQLLTEHESTLSRSFQGRRIVSICEYNLARFSPDTIEEVLRTHANVLLGSDVCPNPFFVPPALREKEEEEARARWKIDQLRKSHRAMRVAETASQLLKVELDRHRETQKRLAKQNRIYSVMTEVSRTLSHVQDRQKLLEAACRIAVEAGGFKMAWVGFFKPETTDLDLVAHCGMDEEYLSILRNCLRSVSSGKTNFDRPILRGEHTYSNDTESELPAGILRESAMNRGLRSSAGFPLKSQTDVVGVFSVYSGEAGFFDAEELRLLDIMAADLSFALDAIDAADALRSSEEKYRALFDNSTDNIMLYRLEPNGMPGRILEANETMCQRLGYSREELLAMTPLDLDSGSLLEMKPDAIESFFSAKHVTFEMGHAAKSGELIAMEVSSHLFEMSGERLVLSTAREITERKRMEQALRESEHRYRALFDNSTDGIIISGVYGAILEANKVACERLGYSREELLQMSIGQIDASDEAGFVRKKRDALMVRGYSVFETAHRTKSGKVVPVEVSAKRIEYEGKNAVFTISRDITERKRIEEQLNRAQRLEVAGRVAGQVAHDFNNLLGPMVAYPELIKMMLPPDHKATKLCNDMLLAAQNMTDINTDMLALSRRGLLNQEIVDLNEVVGQALEQISHAPDTLKVIMDLASDLFPISGSQGQLLRVVSNLVANACDAMHFIGALRISSCNVYVDSAIGQYNRVEIGEYVRLTVEDTGCGIAPEIRDKVFDAFFTTKPASGRRGSGLGLTVVQALVEDHHGYIDLATEVGRGTTFTVYLPATRSGFDQEEGTDLPRGAGTVLVADDDPIQIEVMENLLSALGYAVVKTSSGEEAIAYMRDHEADLVILDMVMPGGIDGAETYRLISEIRPGQKAIIMSGFAETDRTEEARSVGVGSYLRKPVSLEVLAKAVTQEMGSKTAN